MHHRRRLGQGAGAPAHPDFDHGPARRDPAPGAADAAVPFLVADAAVSFLNMNALVRRMRLAFFAGASRERRDDATAR